MDVLRYVRLHACVHACMLSMQLSGWVCFFGLYLPCGSESEVPGTSPSLCFCLALPKPEALNEQKLRPIHCGRLLPSRYPPKRGGMIQFLVSGFRDLTVEYRSRIVTNIVH